MILALIQSLTMLQTDWYSANVLAGAALCFYFAVVLWTKQSGKKGLYQCLSLFAAVLGLTLIDEFLYASQISLRNPVLFGALWPTVFVIGPLFLWFVESICDAQFEIGKKQLQQLTPAMLSLLALLPFLLLNGDHKLHVITQTSTSAITPITLSTIVIIFVGSILSNGYYVFLALDRLSQHKQPRDPADSQNDSLSFLNFLALFVLIVALVFALSVGFKAQFGDRIMLMIQSQMMLMLCIIGYLLVWNNEIETVTSDADKPEKYQSSALSTEQGLHYQQQLLALMQTKQAYRNGELTLPILAEQLGISPNYLSQIINERLELSFREFVNQYRIAEIQQQLVLDPDTAILELAYMSGFKAKSTFYTAFKKQVGMTPSQFRESIANTRSSQT